MIKYRYCCIDTGYERKREELKEGKLEGEENRTIYYSLSLSLLLSLPLLTSWRKARKRSSSLRALTGKHIPSTLHILLSRYDIFFIVSDVHLDLVALATRYVVEQLTISSRSRRKKDTQIQLSPSYSQPATYRRANKLKLVSSPTSRRQLLLMASTSRALISTQNNWISRISSLFELLLPD